jgi:hypothetical protein
MKSSFPSCVNAASAVRVQQMVHSSLGDSAKDNILAGYHYTVTQYNTASQRSVYEAGIYKVNLELEPGMVHLK